MSQPSWEHSSTAMLLRSLRVFELALQSMRRCACMLNIGGDCA